MLKSKGIKWLVAGLIILAMLAGSGCNMFNKPPVIDSLTPSATTVARGESCTISCVATDPDADALTYEWSATGGTISGTGSTVTWVAPTVEGTYTITVTVSDGKDETVSDSCTIEVVNNPPVVTGISPSVPIVAPEESCTVSCVASDADGDALTYEWSATDGTISGTGSTVAWTAPAAEGTYTITVTVSDGHEGTAGASCEITVEMKFGSIDIQSDPTGAAVYLDGVDTENITPYIITNLAPGTYTIKLEYYHYKYREAVVAVNADETTYINWSLTYAPEETLTIQPGAADGKDTYVYSPVSPDVNLGDLDKVAAGTGGPYISRTYIEFSLDSLPEDAIITSATLGLCYWYTSGAVASPIGVYLVEEAWDEHSVLWGNQPDFATGVEDAVNVPAGVTDGFLYWYITELVKGWWDGSVPNYGVMLKDTDESTVEAYKRFRSSDWGTAHERPKLVITYYDPTP